MKNELIVGGIGTSLSFLGLTISVNEVLSIISLIVTIIGGTITFIVVPLMTWYRNSKKDGKIDKEEIKDGINTLQEGITQVVDSVKDKKKGE